MKELELIYLQGMKAYPPRLPEQPIFYPVLNFAYAAQIAKDWNTKSGDFAGYVTEFDIADQYASQFQSHIVGSRIHEEWWVPADKLDEFNRHIAGQIQTTAAFFGDGFVGYVPTEFLLKKRDAVDQFVLLFEILDHNGMDFILETRSNHLSIYLNYSFWQQHDFKTNDITAESKSKVLRAIEYSWKEGASAIGLPTTKEGGANEQ